jgi:hypothetical protein
MFASCYVYSPGGACATCSRSRLLRALLKAGDERFMQRSAARVRQQANDSAALSGFFHPADILIPVPGCRSVPGGTGSVPHRLARALVQHGLGSRVWDGLRRVRTVRKSATCAGRRPAVTTHYESLAVEAAAELSAEVRLVLIDDIVTKGRTFMASASRVAEAYPRNQVLAFALVRTLGLIPGVEHVLDPCVGEIRWCAGDAQRRP